jgi:hypothetical protein
MMLRDQQAVALSSWPVAAGSWNGSSGRLRSNWARAARWRGLLTALLRALSAFCS